jgi:hypothetical protein
MHPVKFLFEEIYREHWGIPQSRKERVRRSGEAPGWFRSRLVRRDKDRG